MLLYLNFQYPWVNLIKIKVRSDVVTGHTSVIHFYTINTESNTCIR